MAMHGLKKQLHGFYVWLNTPYRLATTVVSGPKPTIVLLHGIGAHSATFNGLINELRGQYRIVAIDLLGHGASPSPEELKYTSRDQARSVRWTLWRSGIYGKVVLVGYSLGAIVAVDFAAHYPHKLRHMVLASLPLYQEPDVTKTRHETWAKLMRDVHRDSFRYLRKRPKLVKGYAKLSEKLFGRSPIGFKIDDENWEPFALSLRNAIEHQNVVDDFRRIKSPVDIIYGTHDRVIVPEYIENVGELYRNVRVHTFGGNHEMSQAYSERLAVLIRETIEPPISIDTTS